MQEQLNNKVMSDRFEDFIRDNKDEFDSFAPPSNGWDKISERIEPKQKRFRRRLYIISSSAAAAIIAFLIGSNIFLTQQSENIYTYKNIPELSEAAQFYQSQINEQKTAIIQLASNHPSMIEEMDNDLAELDSALIELKNDLKDNISNEEVVEAMIQNYRMKLMILEDIMVFLDKQQQDDESPIKETAYEL